ncbi:MAG: hypothetical protein U1A23_00725 [Candidatus Sungbacteria bacterium]|nr:hypothetical protein [Candidatus Sungbacteria bacterium]
MNSTLIREFLKSELGKAILGDMAIVGGLEAVKSALQLNKGKGAQNQQSVSAAPAPPKELHKALLKLNDANKIKEITKWMAGLQRAHRLEISKWDIEQIDALFSLPTDARTQLIIAVTGPTPTDELNKFKNWLSDQFMSMSDESKAILDEWEAWADNVLAED